MGQTTSKLQENAYSGGKGVVRPDEKKTKKLHIRSRTLAENQLPELKSNEPHSLNASGSNRLAEDSEVKVELRSTHGNEKQSGIGRVSSPNSVNSDHYSSPKDTFSPEKFAIYQRMADRQILLAEAVKRLKKDPTFKNRDGNRGKWLRRMD